jgi:hypothetical protein
MSSPSPEPALDRSEGPAEAASGRDHGAEPMLDIPSRAVDPQSDAWADGDTRTPDDGDLPTPRSSPLALATATFVLYAITGLASLVVAIAPAYASPLYPSAGIALAAVLVHRMPALVGVFLGGWRAWSRSGWPVRSPRAPACRRWPVPGPCGASFASRSR